MDGTGLPSARYRSRTALYSLVLGGEEWRTRSVVTLDKLQIRDVVGCHEWITDRYIGTRPKGRLNSTTPKILAVVVKAGLLNKKLSCKRPALRRNDTSWLVVAYLNDLIGNEALQGMQDLVFLRRVHLVHDRLDRHPLQGERERIVINIPDEAEHECHPGPFWFHGLLNHV